MGVLDYLGSVDMEEVEEATGFAQVKEGTYEFELINAALQVGTKADDTKRFFVLDYYLKSDVEGLSDGETYREFLNLPKDADFAQTKTGMFWLGLYKHRLLDLGVSEEELNDFNPEDLKGITGIIELGLGSPKKTEPNKGMRYMSVKKLAADFGDEEDEAAPEPEPAKAPAAAKASRPVRNPRSA